MLWLRLELLTTPEYYCYATPSVWITEYSDHFSLRHPPSYVHEDLKVLILPQIVDLPTHTFSLNPKLKHSLINFRTVRLAQSK